MEKKLQEFFEKSSNLFELLGVKESATKKEIKNAQKDKALLLHPDKNKSKDAALKFQKVKEAQEILSKENTKEDQKKYLAQKREKESRQFHQTESRSNFAKDLLQKEDNIKRQKEEEEKIQIQKVMKKMEEIAKQKEIEKNANSEKNVKEFLDEETNKQLFSIKIKWPGDIEAVQNEDLLKMLFEKQGKIKEIAIFLEKGCAVIEQYAMKSAVIQIQQQLQEEAVSDHKEMKGNTKEETEFKVKFLIKGKKRIEILSKLKKKKENPEENFHMSTDLLSKIQQFQNRDSNIQEQGKRLEGKKEKNLDEKISKILENF